MNSRPCTKVMITGGFGYVGGRIARRLVADGMTVRVQTRRPPSEWPHWAGEVEVMRADIGDADDRDRLCQGMDAMIHCAAMNEIDCARDSAGALLANGMLSLNLLDSALAASVGRFVYFSTIFVYGTPLAGTLSETTLARPNSAYAITHRTAEDFVLAAHDRGAVDGVVLRLSNAMGAPADPLINRWTLLANDLCRQALTEGKLVMKSSGLNRRDFVPLGDVTAAVAHVLRLGRESLGDGLFNLGSGQSRTIADIAGLIAQRAGLMLGRELPLTRGEPAPGETFPDLDFQMQKLWDTGFKPLHDMAGEIDDTLRLCASAFSKGAP